MGHETGKIAVLGTGAWGTTFAQVLADAGQNVTMWGRRQLIVEMINEGENSTYLPGIELSDSITATTDLAEAVTGAGIVVVAVPTAVISGVVSEAVKSAPDAIYVSLSKGIDIESGKSATELIKEAGDLPEAKIALVSGPNLSREIAEKQPAASVVASTDVETAKHLAAMFHNHYFRPYVSTDVIGCETAGATKNVIALAIGAAEGMGLGTNTRATLITRGLAEITRLGIALGADPATFSGLAGVGDLIATCSSRLSRNYALGYRMGTGVPLREALELSPGVAEGVRTAGPLVRLADELGVDMPISRAVALTLAGEATVPEMGEMLLGRPQKMDGWKIELIDEVPE